jgi:hypothetical protein
MSAIQCFFRNEAAGFARGSDNSYFHEKSSL